MFEPQLEILSTAPIIAGESFVAQITAQEATIDLREFTAKFEVQSLGDKSLATITENIKTENELELIAEMTGAQTSTFAPSVYWLASLYKNQTRIWHTSGWIEVENQNSVVQALLDSRGQQIEGEANLELHGSGELLITSRPQFTYTGQGEFSLSGFGELIVTPRTRVLTTGQGNLALIGSGQLLESTLTVKLGQDVRSRTLFIRDTPISIPADLYLDATSGCVEVNAGGIVYTTDGTLPTATNGISITAVATILLDTRDAVTNFQAIAQTEFIEVTHITIAFANV